MQLAAITPDQADTIVAVLGAVATARGTQEPSDADRAVVRAAATHLLGAPAAVPEDLAGSIPGVVAERLADSAARELTLTIAAVLCFAEPVDAAETDTADTEGGRPALLDPSRVTVVDDLARYLRVSALDVVELRRVTKEHRDRVAYDLFRRFLVAPSGDEATMVHTAVVQSETRLDIDARRVHALWDRVERLPAGTVGAELVRYYDDNGWSYPGTDHRQPLAFAAHDFHHVLGGYATTPAGELQVGAFTAGAADRPMDGARLYLLWQQLGVGSPAIPDVVGAFAPESFVAALQRGGRTTRDFVGTGWDPWSIVEQDLGGMCIEYQIGDGGQLTAGEPYHQDPVSTDH